MKNQYRVLKKYLKAFWRGKYRWGDFREKMSSPNFCVVSNGRERDDYMDCFDSNSVNYERFI